MTGRPEQRRVAVLLRNPSPAVMATVFVVAMVAYSTAGFLFFEKPQKPELQWGDALWWTFVTMCTVGYGDYFPATASGRLLVGIPIMLTGVGILSFALSELVAFLNRTQRLRLKGLSMHKLTGHTIICNFPSHARVSRLVRELRARPDLRDAPVALVDETLAELDDELSVLELHFVRGHPARRDTLERASLRAAARAVVLAKNPSDPASDTLNVATCMTLRELRPDLQVVSECVDPDNMELLRRAGCGSVVCVSDLAPGILAHELHDPGVARVLEELTLWKCDDNNVFVVPVITRGAATHTVSDLHAWALDHDMLLLGVRTRAGVAVNPPRTQALLAGDAAVLVGRERPERVALDRPAARAG